jgi:hypothetical protein
MNKASSMSVAIFDDPMRRTSAICRCSMDAAASKRTCSFRSSTSCLASLTTSAAAFRRFVPCWRSKLRPSSSESYETSLSHSSRVRFRRLRLATPTRWSTRAYNTSVLSLAPSVKRFIMSVG